MPFKDPGEHTVWQRQYRASLKNARSSATRHTVRLPKGEHKIWLIGCTHFGAESHRADLWEQQRAWAVDEGWQTVHLGDLVDLETPAFRDRHDINAHEEQDLEGQVAYAREQLTGINLVAGVNGNHDERFNIGSSRRDVTGKLWRTQILPTTGGAYLGYTGILTFRVGTRPIHFALNHGVGGGMANPRGALNRLRDVNEGMDVYAAGQNHDLDIAAKSIRTPTGNRTAWYARVPSFLGEAEYGDRANYGAGGACGSLLVTIDSDGVAGVEPLIAR